MQRYCRVTAPTELAGSFAPIHCDRIVDRHGNHAGDHKAHIGFRMGRVNFHWRQAKFMKPIDRPVVVLPVKTSPELEHIRAAQPRTRMVG